MNEEPKKDPRVNLAAMLDGLTFEKLASQKTITTKALVRPQTFEGRRAGETHEFTKRRKKNREKNRQARASRKR